MSRRSLPFVVVVLAGCATAEQPMLVPAAAETAPAPAAQPAVAVTYELGKDELALDCKKLSGRMRVRIMQVRNHAERGTTSEVARIAQTAVTPIFGGTRHGLDPVADQARDRAMLEAYNRRLAEKKCKVLDLEAELRPQPPAAPAQK